MRAGAVAVLLLLALAPRPAGAREGDPACLPEPPVVQLDLLEPVVAAQIDRALCDVSSALARPELLGAEKAEVFGAAGQLLHAYELLDAAGEAYAAAACLAPGDARWLHLGADAARRRGDLEGARSLYASALAVGGPAVPALIGLGDVSLALGLLPGAEAAYREAAARDPAEAAAHAGLGSVFLARRAYVEAIAAFGRALALAPEATRLRHSLAAAYRGLGDLDEARGQAARAGRVGLRPRDPLVDALRDLTSGETAPLLRGRLAFAAGRPHDAVGEFRAAVAANPRGVPALVNLGAALVGAGEAGAGQEALRRALEVAPENATAHFNLGRLLSAAGRREEALPHLQAAVDARPDDAEAWRSLAEAQAGAGKSEGALLAYRVAWRLNPSDEEVLLGGARILVGLGRYREAANVLGSALARSPSWGRTTAGFARLLAASPDRSVRDGPRAVELAARVHAASPTPDHARTLALAHAESGDCAGAARWQRKVLEGAPGGWADLPAGTLRRELDRYEAGSPCRP